MSILLLPVAIHSLFVCQQKAKREIVSKNTIIPYRNFKTSYSRVLCYFALCNLMNTYAHTLSYKPSLPMKYSVCEVMVHCQMADIPINKSGLSSMLSHTHLPFTLCSSISAGCICLFFVKCLFLTELKIIYIYYSYNKIIFNIYDLYIWTYPVYTLFIVWVYCKYFSIVSSLIKCYIEANLCFDSYSNFIVFWCLSSKSKQSSFSCCVLMPESYHVFRLS